MAGICLTMDVGGSSVKYALTGPDRRLTEHSKVPTPHGDRAAYLDALTDVYRLFQGRVEGIALSVPGIIDSEGGLCKTTGALELGEDFPLVQELQVRCGVPVTIVNDAKAAALAEAAWGSLAGCCSGVVIVLGTGIGGALLLDGKVLPGRHFAAGEFSTICLDHHHDDIAHTWCGLNGSSKLITTAAYAKGVDPASINGEDVFRWVNEGDEAACMALDSFTLTLAGMIRNLQLIFDPERFAIGGGISQQPKLMESLHKNLDQVERLTARHGMPRADVVTCKYYNDANLIGAYAYYVQRQG